MYVTFENYYGSFTEGSIRENLTRDKVKNKRTNNNFMTLGFFFYVYEFVFDCMLFYRNLAYLTVRATFKNRIFPLYVYKPKVLINNFHYIIIFM